MKGYSMMVQRFSYLNSIEVFNTARWDSLEEPPTTRRANHFLDPSIRYLSVLLVRLRRSIDEPSQLSPRFPLTFSIEYGLSSFPDPLNQTIGNTFIDACHAIGLEADKIP